MKKIFFLLLFCFSVLYAQVEHSSGVFPYTYAPKFYFDVVNYQSDQDGKTRVDVFVKMPYENIQFVKKNNSYIGKYSLTLTFFDEDQDKVLLERIWNEEIKAGSYTEASSKKNFNYSYRSFELAPGKYFLRCMAYDKDSRKDFITEAIITVKEFSEEIDLSDILLVSRIIKTTSGDQLLPSISNTIDTKDSTFYSLVEVYSPKNQALHLEYQIKDKNNNVVFTEYKDVDLAKGLNSYRNKFENISFSLGVYTLTISIRDEDWKVVVSTEKKMRSKIYGFPDSITDLEKAVDQMTYIATSSQMDSIKEVENFDQMLLRFNKFWKSKDPSPNTIINEVFIEYFRRVAYANEHFKHYFDGWKTDMGMIYIVLGPPNSVDRHPFDYDSKPYEVWDYYDINKRFIFVDETGFGDYRLVNPQFGDWYRYRQ